MATITIRMAVKAPEDAVQDVVRLLGFIDRQPAAPDGHLDLAGYDEDFCGTAMGVLASMSIVADFVGPDGEPRTRTEYVLERLERGVEDGRPSFHARVSPAAKTLVHIALGQQRLPDGAEGRSAWVQRMAQERGL